ncbi:glycerophosphodiester phosphodiesterase family protein [Enterococcus diestrammenae]|uniref:glycerophosphodiester phosphodiesterase family protein n=1 Tax=Enterococcus diestrammenae TaxID=1155073 RepID=UPI0022E6C7B8|nr:glycerophosphodiester phosphodiesterase family protein [Enterococcus diestrammenae]
MNEHKQSKFIIDVSAPAKRPNRSTTRFFSYDSHTAEIVIQAEKDGKLIDQALVDTVEIYFESVNLKYRPIDGLKWNDTMDISADGLYSYILPDDFLNYEGLVAFDVYINYKNGDKADSSNRIIFEQRVSAIDRAAGAVELVYIKDMETAKREITEQATEITGNFLREWNAFEAGSTAKMQELEQRIDDQTEIFNNADVYNKAEIEDKLELFALRTDIAEVSAQLADIAKVRKTEPTPSKMIGHRGFYYAPENSLASLELAAKHGLHGVETDVRLTADGHFVIMHDETVDRTTNGTGRVDSLTLAEIRALTIDAGENIAYYPGLKVPTLAEWLDACQKHGLFLLVDSLTICPKIDEFLALLRQYDMEASTCVLSNLKILSELKAKSNLIHLSYIVFEPLSKTHIDTAAANGVGLSYYSNSMPSINAAYEEDVRYAYDKGVELNAWTENNILRVKKLRELGITYVSTDLVTNAQLQPKLQQTDITIVKESEYKAVMSAALNVKQTEIPTVDGYFVDTANNAVHFKSTAGKSGFAVVRPIGRVKKGDIIEVIADVDVKSGSVRTVFDTSIKTGNELVVHDIGRQLIHRRFVAPYDNDAFAIALGVGNADAGEYAIYDGVVIKVTSMRNLINKPVERLRATIVTDAGTLEERFTLANGDSCTITKASNFGVYVTFDQTLNQKAVTIGTAGIGADIYRVKTGYETANRTYVGILNASTGAEVTLASLPAKLYVNLLLV